MKPVFIFIFIIAVALASGCKKGKVTKPGNQHPEWVLYNTANSTLTNNFVNAIAIDKNDVKWIGTSNGLIRISGNNWTVFNHTNSTLPSLFIRALAVEDDGTVWVGTDQGIARYNAAGWSAYTTSNSVFTDNAIMCIIHDSNKRITWVGTERELVQVTNGNQWKIFDETEDDLILSMAADHNGALWLGTFNHFSFRGRIKKFDNGNWTTYQLDQLGYPSALPYAVGINKNNSVLAVLSGTSTAAVIQFSNSNWLELPRPDKATGLKTILLEGNNVWVGGNALSIFGGGNSTSFSIPVTYASVKAMALDHEGRKWLGTVGGGLVVYTSTVK